MLMAGGSEMRKAKQPMKDAPTVDKEGSARWECGERLHSSWGLLRLGARESSLQIAATGAQQFFSASSLLWAEWVPAL